MMPVSMASSQTKQAVMSKNAASFCIPVQAPIHQGQALEVPANAITFQTAAADSEQLSSVMTGSRSGLDLVNFH